MFPFLFSTICLTLRSEDPRICILRICVYTQHRNSRITIYHKIEWHMNSNFFWGHCHLLCHSMPAYYSTPKRISSKSKPHEIVCLLPHSGPCSVQLNIVFPMGSMSFWSRIWFFWKQSNSDFTICTIISKSKGLYYKIKVRPRFKFITSIRLWKDTEPIVHCTLLVFQESSPVFHSR